MFSLRLSFIKSCMPFVVLLIALLHFAACSEDPVHQGDSKTSWKLVWSDEFTLDGTPDSSKWEFDTQGNAWDWGNNEEQNYTSAEGKNAWVEGGRLIIEARKESWTSPVDNETKEYTSARLRTKGKGDWTYGKIEVSAKLPGGKGSWPAIWMLSSDEPYGGWPHSGEIDIMENIGSEPTQVYATVWNSLNKDSDGTGTRTTINTLNTEFHRYSVEWRESDLRFFVDGTQVFSYVRSGSEEQWPYDHPFHLLLNVAVGGDWEKVVDPSIFPIRMEVDYVRVYQLME